MSIYNSGYEAVWKQFALDTGAEYIEGHYGASDQFISTNGPWRIQLDTYTSSAISGGGTYMSSYTRVKAFFRSPDGLTFQVHRRGSLGRLLHFVGSQSIQVGIPEFDSQFVLHGNDSGKIHVIFCGQGIRSLLEQVEGDKIEILQGEGPWEEEFPAGASVLYFNTAGVVTDTARLRGLQRLFVELLNGMSKVGSATPFIPIA